MQGQGGKYSESAGTHLQRGSVGGKNDLGLIEVHGYLYIYIYIFIEREGERERVHLLFVALPLISHQIVAARTSRNVAGASKDVQ